ncbi:hypothetical protein V8F20_012588 [Naviculisporaceae sp. PSN 640]
MIPGRWLAKSQVWQSARLFLFLGKVWLRRWMFGQHSRNAISHSFSASSLSGCPCIRNLWYVIPDQDNSCRVTRETRFRVSVPERWRARTTGKPVSTVLAVELRRAEDQQGFCAFGVPLQNTQTGRDRQGLGSPKQTPSSESMLQTRP